ncbi:hypothetical protein PsYK624_164700 [Phanerochaete sordida]|uniref:Uncharacterized protein n=1 Tax=Phanerochaete sordida TaxID=48140 RepID=A0A9P3GQZ3_9APHY|nr:hypothetical protein PsYK624_164700 [Phanerochaete sordida]
MRDRRALEGISRKNKNKRRKQTHPTNVDDDAMSETPSAGPSGVRTEDDLDIPPPSTAAPSPPPTPSSDARGTRAATPAEPPEVGGSSLKRPYRSRSPTPPELSLEPDAAAAGTAAQLLLLADTSVLPRHAAYDALRSPNPFSPLGTDEPPVEPRPPFGSDELTVPSQVAEPLALPHTVDRPPPSPAPSALGQPPSSTLPGPDAPPMPPTWHSGDMPPSSTLPGPHAPPIFGADMQAVPPRFAAVAQPAPPPASDATAPPPAPGTAEEPQAPPNVDDNEEEDDEPGDVTQRPRKVDDIKIEYHPLSGRGSQIYRFVHFKREQPLRVDIPDDFDECFSPFNSLDDYRFAEVALDAGLKEEQVNVLLDIIAKIRNGESKFSLTSCAEMNAAWAKAAVYHPSFEKHTVTEDYRGSPMSYDMHVRNLWDWVQSVVREPRLGPHFQWDAIRMSKWDGSDWLPYVEDPITGSSMWDAQSALHDDPTAKPLGIILFADKSKISSFGTLEGYPVIARIANIDSTIRNGQGFGGACVVGFLPLMKDTPAQRKIKDWVDFTKVIWHKGFEKILESIALLSRVGFPVQCGDGIERILYPFIHILSADYEEQYVYQVVLAPVY